MQVSQVATAEQVIQFATTHAAQVAALGLFPAAQVVQAVIPIIKGLQLFLDFFKLYLKFPSKNSLSGSTAAAAKQALASDFFFFYLF